MQISATPQSSVSSAASRVVTVSGLLACFRLKEQFASKGVLSRVLPNSNHDLKDGFSGINIVALP